MRLPKHIPQLDVLRGVAVLAVMLYHAGDIFRPLHLRPISANGYLGVDLFFVLSGFLITDVLLNTKDRPEYFSNFYARRALRIWPLYYLLLVFTFAILPIVYPSFTGPIFRLSHPWQSYLFFAQNLFANAQGAFVTLRVTWSLAVEEQFYLVWPVIVWLAPRRTLKLLSIAALAFSVAVRWSGQNGGLFPPVNPYTNPLARLDGLGLGAFLALWIPDAQERVVRVAGAASFVTALPAALIVARLRPGHCSFYALIAAAFAGLLCVAVTTPTLPGSGFLKFTGKISYCLYLVHVPVFTLLGSALFSRTVFPSAPALSASLLFAASVALCYGLAAASWRFYESKFLSLKSRFESVRTIPAAQPLVPEWSETPASESGM